MSQSENAPRTGLTRRTLVTGTITAATAIPLAAVAPTHGATQLAAPQALTTGVTVSMRINGQTYTFSVDARTSLLDLLRDHAGLTGTKKGCDHGQCGACTVLTDGQRTLSCMSFAAMNAGHEIITIEGLSSADGDLHPMQQAFIDLDAFQCGYCTPGQILSGVACVKEGHAGNDADIREYMSGNLCRCAAYPNIVAAVKQAREEMEKA
jgi:xanthine dehydrogenase YagT iron-sulfur-binding subunit